MKRLPTILVVLIVCVCLFFMLFFFQVRSTEKSVVTRFERPVARDISTGLNFRLPWPIEKVHRFDARLRTLETAPVQTSTQDQQSVVVSAFATWRVDDATLFLKAFEREDAAESKLKDNLGNAISSVLKRHPLSDLINTDATKIKFDQIESEALSEVVDQAKTRYGIAIAAIGLKRLTLPQPNTQAVADRMKAERQAVSDQLKAEGKAEADRIIANASEVASKIRSRAEAYARGIEGQGQALAAKSYEVFKKHPELATFLKQLESLGRIANSGEMTVIMDAKQMDPFKLLLPPPQSQTANTP